MKKHAILVTTILLTIGGAYGAQGQEVRLGDAIFGSTSDQTSPNWYLPLLPGVTNTFAGFGANEGLSKTEQFSLGETVAGVKTVKRHIVGSTPSIPTEDWFLAAGTNDDLRVLKLVRAGAVVFEASAAATPPLLLPGTPTDGQTWELFGATMTIDWFVISFTGAKLKLTETAGLDVRTHYYREGGLSVTETSSSSGWRRVR